MMFPLTDQRLEPADIERSAGKTHPAADQFRRVTTGLTIIYALRPWQAPYQSDDPEPTDYRHYEIYTFNKGARSKGDLSGASGIDFNYGAALDL